MAVPLPGAASSSPSVNCDTQRSVWPFRSNQGVAGHGHPFFDDAPFFQGGGMEPT